MSDELLLKEIRNCLGSLYANEDAEYILSYEVAENILAKVKQHYVKWDREKVAEKMAWNYDRTFTWATMPEWLKDNYRCFADQLKEILTGGE